MYIITCKGQTLVLNKSNSDLCGDVRNREFGEGKMVDTSIQEDIWCKETNNCMNQADSMQEAACSNQLLFWWQNLAVHHSVQC